MRLKASTISGWGKYGWGYESMDMEVPNRLD